MAKIVLITKSPDQTGQVLQLAEKLHIKADVSDETISMPAMHNGKILAELFREFAQKGGLQDIIPDPVQWQREQREDRVLPGRE